MSTIFLTVADTAWVTLRRMSLRSIFLQVLGRVASDAANMCDTANNESLLDWNPGIALRYISGSLVGFPTLY